MSSRTRRYALGLTILIVGLGLAGFLWSVLRNGNRASAPNEIVQSERARELAPRVDAAELDALVAGNTQFALDLYHALTARNGNLFFSPHSISTALAMAYAGAHGDTATEMARTLSFSLGQDALHPVFHALDADLMQRASDVEGVQLNIANALWGQDGHPFLPGFLDLLAESYDAPMELTDFIGASEQARADINDWVSEKTEGKITNLMAPGSVTPTTRLVLANAIYFYGTWKLQFRRTLTRDARFYLLDGSDVLVPMMNMHKHFSYAEETGCQAIELRYTGDVLSMVILLPGEGTFEQFEASLSVEQMDEILTRMYSHEVELAMPRFELTSQFSLASTLAQLGMPDAFVFGTADFSTMDGTRELFIGDVFHKAFVSVNEQGTEAAAATGVSVRYQSIPRQMTIDRPFIFFIRDGETGAILFIGRVMDPTAS